MTHARLRAEKIYEMTASYAGGISKLQGASGIIGSGFNLFVDALMLPIYKRMWDDIRKQYQRGEIDGVKAIAFIRHNWMLLLTDLVVDKGLGSIPIVGIYFNYRMAQALTWRLGAWFGLMSALGESVSNDVFNQMSFALVRKLFPFKQARVRFIAPERHLFVEFISAVDGMTQEEAKEWVHNKLID